MISLNKDELSNLFKNMNPDERQKARMKANILLSEQLGMKMKERQPFWRRPVWMSLSASCLVLALCLLVILPFNDKTSAFALHMRTDGDGAVFKLMDNEKSIEDFGTSVNNVDSRPGLEFYIDSENIAKIEISTENEYIYAVDWTKTQHRKFWDLEYYQYFDEETQISVADYSLLYDKKLTMTFDDDFTDYKDIWYRWTAWNMYQWASENDYSRFLGVGAIPDNLSDKEKAEVAAGGYSSGNGHMQLDGYPERLKEDTITITITDRQGKITTKVIHVKVSNNELRQTVVSASLEE